MFLAWTSSYGKDDISGCPRWDTRLDLPTLGSAERPLTAAEASWEAHSAPRRCGNGVMSLGDNCTGGVLRLL